MATKPKIEQQSEVPIDPGVEEKVLAAADKAFDFYLSTEKHGDMEADLWARRNFIAGFKAGAVFGKVK